MNILVSFYVDCGRMGCLGGLFITTKEKLESVYGKTADFGECLGKHSDIQVDLEASQFNIHTDDQDFIEKLMKYVSGDESNVSGFNPFDYLEEFEQEDEES